MEVTEVKRKFLEYFSGQGYQPTDSAPLVIPELHTAFVMSVGLLQLKAVLTQHAQDRNFPPFCMVQRCLRHYDIERVGMNNHLSFFEMAGAISSGDKEQPQVLATLLEFLTDIAGLKKDSLVFTIFAGGDFMNISLPADEVSIQVLLRLDVARSRVFGRGPETNLFGLPPREEACGPAVEIFLDRGLQPSCPNPAACEPGCSCQRFVEIGTCVFLQYLKVDKGLEKLSKIYCEAAVGVERLAFARSNLPSIYDLGSLREVSTYLEQRQMIQRSNPQQQQQQAQICADHLRASVFALAENALPGRGGRAHVLRKLVRRLFARTTFDKNGFMASLPNVVKLVAERNCHIMSWSQEQVHSVMDVLNSEARLFQEGLRMGTIDKLRYLKGPEP